MGRISKTKSYGSRGKESNKTGGFIYSRMGMNVSKILTIVIITVLGFILMYISIDVYLKDRGCKDKYGENSRFFFYEGTALCKTFEYYKDGSIEIKYYPTIPKW